MAAIEEAATGRVTSTSGKAAEEKSSLSALDSAPLEVPSDEARACLEIPLALTRPPSLPLDSSVPLPLFVASEGLGLPTVLAFGVTVPTAVALFRLSAFSSFPV